ncbi:MAG: SDR family NAD(P)-dependent oxidoreductase [Clostridia bacterium]|nr:SDR family NAD(P)-dependent oxidoreductase [Clostridia bacterium]
MENVVYPDKTAIIVGGSSGIGCETAALFTSGGWNVFNISRTPCENIKVGNICADVAVGEDAFRGIKLTAEKHGIDLLVYSAGCSMAAPIEYAVESDYKYLFEVNYFGALKAVQAAVPYMKKKGGKIILVGSLGGDIPIIFDSFYSSSKAALEMFARSARCELKPYNIFVTAVLPGGTATGFTYKRKVYPDEANGTYAGGVDRAVHALAHMEQGGMSANAVAMDVYKVALSDNPPVIKTCGVKNMAYRMLSRVMPEKLTLYMAERKYKQ